MAGNMPGLYGFYYLGRNTKRPVDVQHLSYGSTIFTVVGEDLMGLGEAFRINY